MRDIGNRHNQSPSLCLAVHHWLTINGIIKISSIGPVNRHQWHIAQINTPLKILLTNAIWQGCSLFHGCGGKLMRNAVLTHGNLNLHARIVDFTENLDNTTYCLAIAIWVINNLNANYLPKFCLTLTFRRNQDIVTNTLIFRRNN